ncbi:MAG: hypothetical protein LBF25_01380, partial [Puniceicoccales bacterium]|nr:hypothetical protein [Puniceicoccales bacterium]
NKTAHDEFTRLKKDPEYLKSAVDKYNELNKKNKQLESDISGLSSKSKLTFREKRELTRKRQDLKACKKEKSQLEFKVLKIFILSEFHKRYLDASAAFTGIPKSELKSLVHKNEMFNIASLGPNLNRTNLATGKPYTLQEFMATKAGDPKNPAGDWEPRDFFHDGQKLTAYVFIPKNVGPGQFSQLYLPSPIKTADDVVGDIMNGYKDLEPKARATKQLEEFKKLAGKFCPLVQDAPGGASPEEKVKLTKFAATASILNDESNYMSEAFEIVASSEKAVLTQAVTGRGTTMAKEVYKQIERLEREISS